MTSCYSIHSLSPRSIMLKLVCLLAFCLTAAADSPPQQRIMNGWLSVYNYAAVVLVRVNHNFQQQCGGTIINNRSILSAANCFVLTSVNNYGIRVGSPFAHSGGTVLTVSQIINHPNFNINTQDNDITVIRVTTAISFASHVQPALIAGSGFNIGDDRDVLSIGWGLTENGTPSEQLLVVNLWTINQDECRRSYGDRLTDNMMCAGLWNGVTQGSRICNGDAGGPLIYRGIVIGVASYGDGCTRPNDPGVYTRVPRYTNWILANQ